MLFGAGTPAWVRRRPLFCGAANLDVLLDKAYENVGLSELLDAPVAAVAGLTDADGELLRQAFQVKTIGDLGRNKFFLAAHALVTLVEGGAK